VVCAQQQQKSASGGVAILVWKDNYPVYGLISSQTKGSGNAAGGKENCCRSDKIYANSEEDAYLKTCKMRFSDCKERDMR